MKRRFKPDIVVGLGLLLIMFLLVGALFWIWPSDAPPAPPEFIPAPAVKTNIADEYHMFEVYRVIDGDTIALRIPEEFGGHPNPPYRIRLRRYNAPEMHEPGGPEAKARLEGLCLGRKVGTEVFADSYNRLVAEVFLEDGRELGAEMKRLERENKE